MKVRTILSKERDKESVARAFARKLQFKFNENCKLTRFRQRVIYGILNESSSFDEGCYFQIVLKKSN